MDTELLLQKIKKEFPDISWKSVKRTKENWDFYVLILDNKYIFRFAKDKEGAKKFACERRILDYLKNKTSMSVPDYIFRSKDGKFAGYKIIKGGKLMPDEFRKLSHKDKEKIAVQFANFLNTLHSIPRKYFRGFGIQTKVDNDGIDRLHKKIKRTVFPKLKIQETEDIEKFFSEYRMLAKTPYKKVLVHGDLTKENFIYQDGMINGVIDFTDFAISEPALDFKGFWDFGSEFVEMVYKNYTDKGDKLFLERSKLYYKMMGMYVLDGAVNYEHCPFSLKECHKKFRKIFYI